jgi:phage-related protein
MFTDGVTTIELKYVTAVQGLGSPPVNIATSGVFNQDGVSVNSIWYQARPVTLSFDIRQANYAAAVAERRALIRFFADKQPKTFLYSRNNWTVYLSPVYLVAPIDTGIEEVRILSTSLQFLAANPYLKRDIPFSSVALETAELEYDEAEGFEYPLEGAEYSTAQTALTVFNSGDVDSSAVIHFIGGAENPYVQNDTTGKRVTVTKTLEPYEMLVIDSETRTVRVIDNEGNSNNAFQYLAEGSEFIELVPGANIISFGSSGGAIGYVEVGGAEYYAGI